MTRSGELLPLGPALPEPSSSPRSAFDYELESERARWFHRRLLLFCGVKLALATLRLLASIALLIPDLAPFVSTDPIPRPGPFFTLEPLICLAYLGAILYLLRARPLPPLRTLVPLAVCVAGLLPAVGILLAWIEFSFAARTAWMWGAPASLFFHFTFACLLIPWTTRESLATGVILLGTYAALISVDIAHSPSASESAAPPRVASSVARKSLIACTLVLLPGLLVCRWRFSRFPHRFRMLFEIASYRKLQQELVLARRLHESSLPPHDLYTAGPIRLAYVYEPMRELGGDILYVHAAAANAAADDDDDDGQPDRICAVLVDVSGHGIGAALMANRVTGEIQRLFAESPEAPPHHILSALNRYARLTLARESIFATAVCLRIDARAGLIEYANGGHPSPFLVRADGSVTPLESGTFLLGVHEGDDYCPSCHCIPFQPGDAVLAYTDGATEARNPAGEMVTVAGLRSLLTSLNGTPPADWPRALIERIVSHRRASPEDDTLIAAIHRPRSAPEPVPQN